MLLDSLKFIINSYLSLPLNWDGYAAIPPAQNTADDANDFLDKLPQEVILPQPGIAGDGEINLFMKKDKFYIDIGFRGDGTYSYFIRDLMGNEYVANNISLKEDLPSNLIETLLNYRI